jgi:hypothetical protein
VSLFLSFSRKKRKFSYPAMLAPGIETDDTAELQQMLRAKKKEICEENQDVFFNMKDIVHLLFLSLCTRTSEEEEKCAQYIYLYLSIYLVSIGCKRTKELKLRRG